MGLGGGYAYKNLNAEAPINSPTTNTLSPSDEDTIIANAAVKQIINTSIKRSVAENGVTKVFGVNAVALIPTDTTISLTSLQPKSIFKKTWNRLLPKTLAQADPPPCTGARQDLIEAAIANDMGTWWPTFQYNLECIKSAHFHGQLSYFLRSFAGVGYRIEWTFDGDIETTVTMKGANGECFDRVLSERLKTNGSVTIDDRSVTKTEILCKGFMNFDMTYANLDYDRKKCCSGVVQQQTITP